MKCFGIYSLVKLEQVFPLYTMTKGLNDNARFLAYKGVMRNCFQRKTLSS